MALQQAFTLGPGRRPECGPCLARTGGRERPSAETRPGAIAEIEFEQTDALRVGRLSEGPEQILTLTGERISTPRSERLQLFSHLWMDGQPQSSEFKVNAIDLGISLRPDTASLELGDRHPIARELASLLVSRRPIQYAYVPRFEAILYGPEHLTPPLIARFAAMSAAAEQSRSAQESVR